MNEESSNLTFNIGVKPKKEPPKTKAVSSIFKTSTQLPKTTPEKPNESNQQKKVAPKIAVTDNSGNIKAKKESPFLRRLLMAQNNVPPPPPVATETAFNSDTPISGFGEMCLIRQGWKPGLKIGKIKVVSDTASTNQDQTLDNTHKE